MKFGGLTDVSRSCLKFSFSETQSAFRRQSSSVELLVEIDGALEKAGGNFERARRVSYVGLKRSNL